MQVFHSHECVALLATLLILSSLPAHSDVLVREFAPEDGYDWQLARRLSGLAGLPHDHVHWPDLHLDPEGPHHGAAIELVAEVSGLLAGRVCLEAHHHPYCELVNLCVRPDCEGQGVATALVREAICRARALGFKVMVLQGALDDPRAQGIYLKAGFVPATRGEMQRMVCLLDVPLVSNLLKRQPGAEFSSQPASERGQHWWRLSWSAAPDDFVTLYLHGGSCQFDSDGFQPVLQACEFAAGGVSLAAEVEAAPAIERGQTADLLVTVRNLADQPFAGTVRAMLLPDTEVVGEASLAAPALDLQPGEEATVSLPIRVKHEFRCDLLRFGSYPSVPMTAEICWERGSLLLSSAVKVL
jgi:ribosomal protein S18 acetylase RimI-like enzyme